MRHPKKVIILFMLLIVEMWLLMGCDSKPPVDENIDLEEQTEVDSGEVTESFSLDDIAELGLPEDMLAYWLVLNGKKPFVSIDEGNQRFYWKEYYWCLGRPVVRRQADYFMIVDMNGDGADEIVLGCSPESTQVLHYEDGEVYSYQFVYRGMMRIHNNGIYEGSDGASSTFYYRLTELNKDGYKKETIAVMDGDYYEVEGNEAAYEEFCDYVDPIESVATADCMEFTESMLDRELLGNLSEQDLALMKQISAENMLENEPDYQDHKQALQSYIAVLKGEQDVILVAEDKFMDDDDFFVRYFSLADMDGDGSYELVFTCNDYLVWILHYEGEKVYGYPLRTQRHKWQVPIIATDGVFQTEDESISSTGYARIVNFGEDGYRTEPLEDYDISSHDWIRYYFYSEETIAQGLK